MPRWITSSVSSWAVQWVMGRPDFSGGSQATAKIWVTCSGVNLPGAPGRGSSREDRFDGPSQVGAGLAALDVNESVPGVGPAPSPASDLAVRQADLCGDVFIEQAVEGQEDDRGALPEPRGCGDGIGKRSEGFPADVR